MTPVRAEAAATTEEQRYTWSSFVPLRPGKFRLKARRLFTPADGTGPGPGHAPQVDSEITAPAARRSAASPSRAITSKTRWLPGKSTKATDQVTFRPLTA